MLIKAFNEAGTLLALQSLSKDSLNNLFFMVEDVLSYSRYPSKVKYLRIIVSLSSLQYDLSYVFATCQHIFTSLLVRHTD